jgi:nitroimidazol reductase NimA-like FMN-containing flavoprotein (pyridoxamine 5'-phosphate oxidase superfamily)
MRSLSESEIREFLQEWKWGTLIAVEGDKPYAIELSYAADGKFIYCGSMPGGRMSRSVKNNARVAFKICDSSEDTSRFRAVIVEGTVKKLSEEDEIVRGLTVLYTKMGIPESRIEKRAPELIGKGEESSFYRISMDELGGRAIGM